MLIARIHAVARVNREISCQHRVQEQIADLPAISLAGLCD
jgi:hypothetical protein